MDAAHEARIERGLKTVGLVAGPLVGLLVFALNPGGHPPQARRLLGILALAILWWMSEAIALPATALVASALAIAAGVAPARQVLAPYADPVIFLFLGTFLLAEAFRRYGLDLRVASALVSVPLFRASALGLMAGFGVTSAALSTTLSNTATAALVTPVALGALDAGEKERRPGPLDSAVLLMIAYGASIGGMATLIGTPPNLLVAGFLERLAGVRITFTGWLAFGLPIAACLLVISVLLTRLTLGRGLAVPGGIHAAATAAVDDPGGAWSNRIGVRWTLLAFVLALALWTAPAVAAGLLGRDHPLADALDRHFPEAGVALLCAGLLFVAPIDWSRRRFALSWTDGQRVNWGILLLFGGGLSLGTLGEATGLARWAGEGIVRSGLASSPEGLMLVAVAVAVVLSEFASNTACATVLIPVVIASAQQAGFDPAPPALAAGLAATCGFIFPVSTPPNAIVFGTGRVPLTRMIRAGAVLDVAAILVIWLGMLLLGPLLPRGV
jgi:sodium-dependent dicarboxylate transporter 2/3/5